MAQMTTTTHVCRIDVDFFSAGDRFASEIISFEIKEGADVWTSAHLAAEASTYFDLRIPELSYSFSFVPTFPDEPDPTTPAGGLKPVCRDCACDMLARDASARWDVQRQGWAISGVYDFTFCDLCNAESDDLARWVPADDPTPFDRFAAALVDTLCCPELAYDSAFHLFCLAHALTHTVEDARAAWMVDVARRSSTTGGDFHPGMGGDHG